MSSKIWGTYTWIFFHTLAEKIKEEHFESNRKDFINIIIKTCNHLPCPDCSEHATSTLKKANLENIKTKKHFIEFLRQFHNIVNIKINKKEMSEESIINLYSSNSLEIVLMNMINSYRSVKTSERLMMYNFHRNNFLKELILDINNLRKFLNN